MRYGLEIAAAGACGDPRRLAELARVAEASGWDGVYLEDYIVHWKEGLPAYDPWIGLAAMALATERIRIGTTVTPLPRRRPWKVAREAVTIDHLSGGRCTLGVGIGGLDDAANFDRFGEATGATTRAAMLDEGLAILAGMWSGQPFGFVGEHYQMAEQVFLPQPVQRPRIPIWVGGSGLKAAVVRRTARWDGIVPVPVNLPDGTPRYPTREEVRAMRAAVDHERGAERPFDIAIGGMPRGEDWSKERDTIAELAEAGTTWWMEWVPDADWETMGAAIARGPLRID